MELTLVATDSLLSGRGETGCDVGAGAAAGAVEETAVGVGFTLPIITVIVGTWTSSICGVNDLATLDGCEDTE